MNPISQRLSKDTAWYRGREESSVEPKANRQTVISTDASSSGLGPALVLIRTIDRAILSVKSQIPP